MTAAGTATVLLAAAIAAPAAAATSPNIARVSLVQGDVTVMRGDSSQQVAAAMNAPLLPGDTLATGGGRAEAQFDSVSMLRLDRNAQVRFANLSPAQREVQLAQGTTELALLRGENNPPQIDTPSVSVRPDGAGLYRVAVRPDGSTVVAVRSGRADVWTPQGTRTLDAGQSLIANGPAPNVTTSLAGPIPTDGFDGFNSQRDATLGNWVNGAADNRYANFNNYQTIGGYGDLSNYGQWVDVPNYGSSWVPQQNANWAPYQNGSWAWEPNYGYTWVSNEPWGWAPYHYGRWFYSQPNGGWLWQPPAATNNVASSWAPALVGVVVSALTGNNVSNPNLLAGLLTPQQPYAVGWVPLAPGEPYQPWYGWGAPSNPYPAPYSPGYNAYQRPVYAPVTNITYITNYYVNARYHNAIVFVNARDFDGGHFRRPWYSDERELRHVALVRGGLPIVPTAASLAFSERPVRRVAISPAFLRDRFAHHVVIPRRVAFVQQRAHVVETLRRMPHVNVAAFRDDRPPASIAAHRMVVRPQHPVVVTRHLPPSRDHAMPAHIARMQSHPATVHHPSSHPQMAAMHHSQRHVPAAVHHVTAHHPPAAYHHATPIVYHAPAYHAVAMHRPAAYHPAPAYHPVHAYHPAPVYHAPVYHAAPVHRAPAYHPVRAYRPAPAAHPAPARHPAARPAPAHHGAGKPQPPR